MKYVEEYLNDVIKVKPLGKLTTKDDELNGMSGEMVYIDGKCSDIFISHADYANWLEKQSEQKFADKTEPKFHEGEWILYSGDNYEGVRYITKIDENGYYIERNGLPHGIIPFNHEICMKLWTIQDAKDGDVLITNKKQPFIFNGHYDEDTEHIFAYCGISDFLKDDSFLPCDEEFKVWCTNENVCPATKEQRDLLFAKMKEAGYEWDVNNKKLKKIEQNPEHPYCQEHCKGYKESGGKCYFGFDCEAKRDAKKNAAWSEEDEEISSMLIELIESKEESMEAKVEFVAWIKSFKQRIGG